VRHQRRLTEILRATRTHWDHQDVRPAVRENFAKVLKCQTLHLGAELFSSGTKIKVVPHTCKSRSCPSCGYRATLLWQREQWALLPDVSYAGVVFTMPNVLWPIFEQNRRLLHDLPALGTAVIQQWAKVTYGVHLLLMVVQHTSGRHLNFYPHLHILVSTAGLNESQGRWVGLLKFDKRALMHMWRYALIMYLRQALQAKILQSHLSAEELKAVFKTQYERWWDIHIDRFQSKSQFLRYAGRYLRRPPLAQRRIVEMTDREVRFWTKDTRTKQVVVTRCSLQGFVAMLADHVPDRYRHAVRYFGLLSPGLKPHTSAALFMLVGQVRRTRPRRLSWANSLQKYFGVSPLVDSEGRPMRWAGRLRPGSCLGGVDRRGLPDKAVASQV